MKRDNVTTLIGQLNNLESSGLIRLAQAQPELEYLFRHALVQDAAYSSLVKNDRRRLHEQVGEALERAYPDRLASRELAPLLARHFDAAGDDRRAVDYYTLAGDASLRQYANAEAEMHFARAIELVKRATHLRGASHVTDEQLMHLYVSYGSALRLNGKYDEALAHYIEMERLAHERDDRRLELAGLMERATIHSTPTPVQNSARARQLMERALDLARSLGDRAAESKIFWNLMLLHLFSEDALRAAEYGEQSLALARELGLREQLAFTLNDLSSAYLFDGQTQRGLAALREARELWQALGNVPMLADSHSSAALIHFYIGEYDRAIALASEGLRLSQSISNLWGQTHGWGMLGYPLQELGEMDKAIEAWEASVRFAEPGGLVAALIGIRVDLAWLYGTLGAIDHGLETAHLALARTVAALSHWRPWVMAVLARLYLLKGDRAQAEAAVRDCGQIPLRDLFARLLWSGANAVVLADGELALAQGDTARVASLMDNLLPHLRSLGARAFLSDALHLKGKALLAQGRLDDAQPVLADARAAAESIGSRRALWSILLALSEIEAQRGNQAEAETLRGLARAIVDYIAEHAGSAELRATFLNLPDVRAVYR